MAKYITDFGSFHRKYDKADGKLIFISNSAQIDFSKAETNKNIMMPGEPGGGKSWLMYGVCNQNESGIVLDSKGLGIETLKEMRLKNWSHYNFFKKPLKTNVVELKEQSINVLFEEKTKKQKRIMFVLAKFCRLPDAKKNFETLKEKLSGCDADRLIDELSDIFDKNDRGTPLKKIMEQKICYNIRGLNTSHRGLGLLIKMLYDFRYFNKGGGEYFLGIDDAQTALQPGTSLASSFSRSSTEGRQFRILNVIVGTHDSYLPFATKATTAISFYFPSKALQKRWKERGVDFEDRRFKELKSIHPEGCCILETDLPVILYGKRVRLKKPLPVYFDFWAYMRHKNWPSPKEGGGSSGFDGF